MEIIWCFRGRISVGSEWILWFVRKPSTLNMALEWNAKYYKHRLGKALCLKPDWCFSEEPGTEGFRWVDDREGELCGWCKLCSPQIPVEGTGTKYIYVWAMRIHGHHPRDGRHQPVGGTEPCEDGQMGWALSMLVGPGSSTEWRRVWHVIPWEQPNCNSIHLVQKLCQLRAS